MLKACIEIISTGQFTWIEIPNGDLDTAISDFTEDKDYEVAIITGLKIDGITTFPHNTFYKCDIFQFNDLILDLETNFHFDSNDFDNLAFLNLLLENRNHDVEEVGNIIRGEKYRLFTNVDHMGDVAMDFLEETSEWYQEAKNNCSHFERYFDYKSYGEEVLESSGNWLHDKNKRIIVEVFE